MASILVNRELSDGSVNWPWIRRRYHSACNNCNSKTFNFFSKLHIELTIFPFHSWHECTLTGWNAMPRKLFGLTHKIYYFPISSAICFAQSRMASSWIFIQMWRWPDQGGLFWCICVFCCKEKMLTMNWMKFLTYWNWSPNF